MGFVSFRYFRTIFLIAFSKRPAASRLPLSCYDLLRFFVLATANAGAPRLRVVGLKYPSGLVLLQNISASTTSLQDTARASRRYLHLVALSLDMVNCRVRTLTLAMNSADVD